jgi:hypothetical protein
MQEPIDALAPEARDDICNVDDGFFLFNVEGQTTYDPPAIHSKDALQLRGD